MDAVSFPPVTSDRLDMAEVPEQGSKARVQRGAMCFAMTEEFKAVVDEVNPGIAAPWSYWVCYCVHQMYEDEDMLDVDVSSVYASALISVGDVVTARARVRGFLITRFEYDVEISAYAQPNAAAHGNILGVPKFVMSGFWTAFAKGCAAIGTARKTTSEALWALARKAFEASLGGHYQLLIQAASWIKDVWVRMQAWCDEIITQHARWMGGFKECLVLGVGLIGVAAVLVLIEKFMIGCNLIGGPLGLAQTFVLCYVGFVGLREGGAAICSSVHKQLSSLVAACQGVVHSISCMLSADGTLGSTGQSDPVTLLETFAKGLAAFAADGLVKTGRTFNAITQIKNGCASLWSSVLKISEFLWNLLDKGFNIRSKALADLSVMLGKDVQGWLKRCDAACEHMLLFPSVPQDILRNFKVLKNIGLDIRSALLARSDRGSTAALHSVNKALEKITELLVSATLAGSNGPRYEPLWLAFVGDPGVGKSTAVNTLVARYLNDNNLDGADSYSRNTMDAYWSGYRRQTVVTYDDLGALSNGTSISEEAELIKLISRDALPLNMASLEEKGMYFDSSLVITSSNFVGYSPHAQIHDAQAYYRRRSMLVRIVAREGVAKEAVAPLAHQRYQLLNSLEPFNVLQTFETFEDLYAYFLDVQQGHVERQHQIMATMKTKAATIEAKVVAVTTLLAIVSQVTPLSFEEFIRAKHPGWKFLIYHDDILYLINDKHELRVVKRDEDLDAADCATAQANALSVAMRYSQLLRSMPLMDTMATHFLADLVGKNAFTSNLQIRKRLQSEDEQLYEVAVEIPEWQRAFIYVLSANVSADNKGLFGQLYEGMCDTLQRVYATDVASWPIAVKLGLGVVAFLVFGKATLWALTKLGSFGSGAAFTLAATRTFVQGQSDDEVRKTSSEYRHRNSPIKVRHWSRGQNFGISYEWLMKHCLASVHWAHLECQALVLPGKQLVLVNHFAVKIPDGAVVSVSMDDQKYHISWHTASLKVLEDSELAVYSHATLRDASVTILERVAFGLESLPDTFEAVMCSCKSNPITKEYDSEVAQICVKKRSVAMYVYAGEYQRKVPVCLEYEANTVNRDCGSLIIANIGGVDKLVGIHVAGIGGRGQACFLPMCLERTVGQNWFADDFVEFSLPRAASDGTMPVGVLKPEKKFHTQQKTSFEATPDEWHLGTPCDKEPAVLSSSDPRLPYPYDPYTDGLEKYAQAAGPFESEVLLDTAADIGEEWHDAAHDFDFSECSLEAAINGVPGVEYYDPLVLNTSEGYPYLLSRNQTKGKSRFLVEQEGQLVPCPELARGIERIEAESAVRVPVLVGVECAKDEKLPKRKIYEKPKTRLFTVLPMDFNIVVRKKFFPFVKFLMEKRSALPCQVGLNPYSREWGRVATTLLEKGDQILCCDYSRFDGIMPKQVMWVIALMVNKLMGGSEKLQTQRMNLLMACCGRYGICAGKVWRVENGIPSGFPLTVIINSVFNELIVRYIYRLVFRNDRLMAASFPRYVSIVTYGDDNLISVSPTIAERFNGQVVQNIASEHGITITDGVDKTLPTLTFRKLAQCDFLKRAFRKDEFGRWRAPMALESLWSQLHWVRTKHLGRAEAYIVNLEAVLRELYLHDEGLVRLYRTRALAISWVMPEHVPKLEQIRAFHEMHMEGNVLNCFAYDALVSPTILGPIGAKPKEVGDFEFRGFVATVSGSYKFEDGDFVVCLKVASRYGVDGVSLDWPATSGRGELPTAVWLRKQVLDENCGFLKLIRAKHAEGKRIVFLARNNNVYAVVFFVLVALRLRIITVVESNMLLSKAINVVHSLGYLVDVFPEAFFATQVKDIAASTRRILNVYNATPAQLSHMRRATLHLSLQRSMLDVPLFRDTTWVEAAKFILDKEGPGILLAVNLEMEGMGGLPGFNWYPWLQMGAATCDRGKYTATVVYFDAVNVLVCDYHVVCSFRKGTAFNQVVCVGGKPLADVRDDTCNPVFMAMRDLEAKLGGAC